MIRIAAVLVLVVATVAAWPAAGAVARPADASAVEDSPGAALSGAIAVHGTDLDSEVEARALEVALERANRSASPNRSRASVLAARLEVARERVGTLERRRVELVEAQSRGEIGEGAYRVRLVALTAEARAHERLLARSRAAAADLPSPIRREHGLADATYRTLVDRTRNVTAGEFAVGTLVDPRALAGWNRSAGWNGSIAWNGSWTSANVSRALVERIDRDDRRVDSLRANRSALERYDDGDDPAVREALACARDELDRAAAAVADAREAAGHGNETAVRRHLDAAESRLGQAEECLVRGWEAAREDGSTGTADSDDSSWNGSENWTYDSSKYS